MECLGASGAPTICTPEMKIGPMLKILKPGDIIEFPNVHGDGISHWGVCITKNTMIHLDEDITEEDQEDESYWGKFHDIVDLKSYASDTKCKINNIEFDEYPDYENSKPCSRRRVVKNAKNKASEDDCHQDRWYGCEAFVAWARFYPNVANPSRNVTDFLSSKDLRYDVLESVHLDYFDTVMRRGAVANTKTNAVPNSLSKRKRKTPDMSEKQKNVETLSQKNKEQKVPLDQVYQINISNEPVKDSNSNTDHLSPYTKDTLNENVTSSENKVETQQEENSNGNPQTFQQSVEIPRDFKPTLDYNPYMKKIETGLPKRKSHQNMNFSIMDIESGPEQLTTLPASALRVNMATRESNSNNIASTNVQRGEKDEHSKPKESINMNQRTNIGETAMPAIAVNEHKEQFSGSESGASSILQPESSEDQEYSNLHTPITNVKKNTLMDGPERHQTTNTENVESHRINAVQTNNENSSKDVSLAKTYHISNNLIGGIHREEEKSKVKNDVSVIEVDDRHSTHEELSFKNVSETKVGNKSPNSKLKVEPDTGENKFNKIQLESTKENIREQKEESIKLKSSSKNSDIKSRLEAMLSSRIDGTKIEKELQSPPTRNKVLAHAKLFERQDAANVAKKQPVSDEEIPPPPITVAENADIPSNTSAELPLPSPPASDNIIPVPPPPSPTENTQESPSTKATVPEVPVAFVQPPAPPPPSVPGISTTQGPQVSAHITAPPPPPPPPPPIQGTPGKTVTSDNAYLRSVN